MGGARPGTPPSSGGSESAHFATLLNWLEGVKGHSGELTLCVQERQYREAILGDVTTARAKAQRRPAPPSSQQVQRRRHTQQRGATSRASTSCRSITNLQFVCFFVAVIL